METWRDIPGFEGRYQASDQGRVRSIDHFVRCGPGGKGRRLVKGRVLRDAPTGDLGHRCVVLGKGNTVGVHVAVAATWIGPRPEGLDVAHKNGMADDNRKDNLKYATRTENNMDQTHTGKRLISAELIRRLRACPDRQSGLIIGREAGLSDSYANNIRLGHDAALHS